MESINSRNLYVGHCEKDCGCSVERVVQATIKGMVLLHR